MSNFTTITETASGYALSVCVVPSHAAPAAQAAMRGGVDLRTGFPTTRTFDAGPRSWSPPI